jgi:hypothetical protein
MKADLGASRTHRNDAFAENSATEKGTLYIGARDLTSEGFAPVCPDLGIGAFPGMRKATLDVSGFSLTVGFRMALF